MRAADRESAEQRGIKIGMALAAGILTRDFGDDTRAAEILAAAGLTAVALRELGLDDYDLNPLLKIASNR
jgi:hypothetical protein